MIHTQILQAAEAEPRRREVRHHADGDIRLREFGANPVAARLVNISSRGFMARTDAEIPASSRIWLNLPAVGRVSAVVIWTKGASLGGEFASPIDPLEVLQALGRSHSPRGCGSPS